MQQSLITVSPLSNYTSKEFGPIILALAFVIVLGGATAAAIAVCGWGHVKSANINWYHQTVEILCR